jgi:hypothetical protein
MTGSRCSMATIGLTLLTSTLLRADAARNAHGRPHREYSPILPGPGVLSFER